MQKTGIEYLTHTWSPIKMRCTPVSGGCENCWHLRMAKRCAANPTLRPEARAAYAGGAPWLDRDELMAPLRLRQQCASAGVPFFGKVGSDGQRIMPREMLEGS